MSRPSPGWGTRGGITEYLGGDTGPVTGKRGGNVDKGCNANLRIEEEEEEIALGFVYKRKAVLTEVMRRAFKVNRSHAVNSMGRQEICV